MSFTAALVCTCTCIGHGYRACWFIRMNTCYMELFAVWVYSQCGMALKYMYLDLSRNMITVLILSYLDLCCKSKAMFCFSRSYLFSFHLYFPLHLPSPLPLPPPPPNSFSCPPLFQSLTCLVQLASVRRSLFNNAERTTFLAQLVKGVKSILEQPQVRYIHVALWLNSIHSLSLILT